MTIEQTANLTLEIGPGMPGELGAFTGNPDAFAALLMAFFRLLTAERIYVGPEAEFVGTKGDFTVRLQHSTLSISQPPSLPTVLQVACTASITLESPDNPGETSEE
jgi:hypothetical protein